VRKGPGTEYGQPEERTTLERLRAEGFSEGIIEAFFRPFFGGVFLDSELRTSERQLEFVFEMFSAGDIAVPALGMGEIPRQLANGLVRTVLRTETAVEKVQATAVYLAGGEKLEADAVVMATDADTAGRLVEGVETIPWRSVTCLYFAAEAPPLLGPKLVLNGDGAGPVNNLVVMSEVAPETAPSEAALISVTVLGTSHDDQLETGVRRQLQGWLGSRVDRWRHLASYAIERALPDQRAPRPRHLSPRLENGLYVCGDHRSDGSINGAMASGREAANAVVEDLEGSPP
jgi:protoporphyrinogen oxidase